MARGALRAGAISPGANANGEAGEILRSGQ